MSAMAYDRNNIFARILRGELPCHKVYEDTDILAFLDIMPRGDGHTLVIPKSPACNLLDIDGPSLSRLMLGVQKVARGAKQAMNAAGVTLEQFNEAAGGQVVFHLHFHIIPRFTGVSMRRHTGEMAAPEMLKAHAEMIAAVLKG
jgi:histidine triad (HIT) family protein